MCTYTHTHRATHLKGLCLLAPTVEQAKQKRIATTLQCQIKPKGAQCTAMRVKEEEAAGKFWQQRLVFAKQMKLQEVWTCSVVWEQVVPDLTGLFSPAMRKPMLPCLWRSCFLTMPSVQ